MRIPALGPRGEGWAVAQLVIAALILVAGIAGPRWPSTGTVTRLAAGIVISVSGWALLFAGVVGLGRSLTPFPRPSIHADLRMGGVYRIVRHPIYGGLMLVALGWSLLSSPVALATTAVLVALFEAKARLEESLLVARFPEYEGYRRRVKWRFLPGVR